MLFSKKSRTFKKEENSKAESVAEKGTKKCTQTSLELTLAFSEVVKAEIRWALNSALKRNSNGQNANISTPLKLCF